MARAESGSIQQLGKNRWRVRVSGGKDPVTGKRIRLSKVVHGTRKDAIAERTRLQIEVGDVDRATKDMTLAQYFDEVFMPWQKARIRATSYSTVSYSVNKHIIPHLGGIHLRKLSAYTVETWAKTIEGHRARSEAFRILKQAYTQAYRWDLVSRNIFDKLESPKREKNSKVVADAELVTLIMAAVYGDRIEAPFLLQISCGLRPSEACALDWEDIDFRTGKVRIHRTFQLVRNQGRQFFDVKTEKSRREISIPEVILERLREIRCADGIVRFGPIAIGFDGERMAPGNYSGHYRNVYKKKLPDQPYITPKNLRHSHATILLALGTDLKTISERLGHADIATTAAFYIQKVEELDEKASVAFDSAIRVARPSPPKDPSNVIEIKPAKEA